jgi:hypothetical protein
MERIASELNYAWSTDSCISLTSQQACSFINILSKEYSQPPTLLNPLPPALCQA